MGNSNMDSEEILLYDNWPGSPIPLPASFPQDGFSSDAAGFNNVGTIWPVGTKIQVMCDGTVGQPGPATFIYLRVGTQNTSDYSLDAKMIVAPDSATIWYEVSNDPDTVIESTTGQVAVALEAMTDAYYGWFWCGGVCPEQYVDGLGGTYRTSGEVEARDALSAADLDSPDLLGFGRYMDDATHRPCGFAISAD